MFTQLRKGFREGWSLIKMVFYEGGVLSEVPLYKPLHRNDSSTFIYTLHILSSATLTQNTHVLRQRILLAVLLLLKIDFCHHIYRHDPFFFMYNNRLYSDEKNLCTQ